MGDQGEEASFDTDSVRPLNKISCVSCPSFPAEMQIIGSSTFEAIQTIVASEPGEAGSYELQTHPSSSRIACTPTTKDPR